MPQMGEGRNQLRPSRYMSQVQMVLCRIGDRSTRAARATSVDVPHELWKGLTRFVRVDLSKRSFRASRTNDH